jgi:plastocyanin
MRVRGRTALAAIVLAVLIGVVAGCGSSVNPRPPGSPPGSRPLPVTPIPAIRASPPTSQPPAPSPATSWTVTAGGDREVYRYLPATLAVPTNVPVTVRFVDGDVLDHTWTVFDADGSTVLATLAVAKEGDEATGSFTFSKPGTYRFWCTIPGHEQFGEVGTLIVVP